MRMGTDGDMMDPDMDTDMDTHMANAHLDPDRMEDARAGKSRKPVNEPHLAETVRKLGHKK